MQILLCDLCVLLWQIPLRLGFYRPAFFAFFMVGNSHALWQYYTKSVDFMMSLCNSLLRILRFFAAIPHKCLSINNLQQNRVFSDPVKSCLIVPNRVIPAALLMGRIRNEWSNQYQNDRDSES
jgi:hypothetical protein